MIKLDKKEKIILMIALGLALVASLSTAYFLIQNKRLKKTILETNFKQLDSREFSFEEVAKLTKLPTDEQPTIVRIKDAERAKAQVFFQKAKDGDIVLLYKKAKLAVLYDPVEKIILESGPLIESSSSDE